MAGAKFQLFALIVMFLLISTALSIQKVIPRSAEVGDQENKLSSMFSLLMEMVHKLLICLAIRAHRECLGFQISLHQVDLVS